MPLRIETLGRLRVFRDGAEVAAIPAQRVRCALLIFVAVEADVPRDRIVEMFWPGREPARARRSLSTMLYELRRDLGEDWVDARGDRLVATRHLWSDVRELLEGGDASRLYGGPFLGVFQLPAHPEFARWTDRVRMRAASAFREAQRARVDRLVADRSPDALAAAQRWARLDPIDDAAQYRVIELLARAGRRAEALRHFDDYSRRLEAIDAEPLESLTGLVRDIRHGSSGGAIDPQPPVSTEGAAKPADVQPGIVVFPIANLSEDPERQYFCDGLVEEIMHALARAPGLRVVPRTSAFSFDGPSRRVREATRALGISHALEGTVRFAGDRYRVRVALVEGAGEVERWQSQFEGRLASTDVFELQDQIAEAVFTALVEHLGDGPAVEEVQGLALARRDRRGETTDPDAQRLYHEGRRAWYRRTLHDLETALARFQEAVERDPAYARPYVGMADVYLVYGGLDYQTYAPTTFFPLAKEAAERALELDPDSGPAHAALGNYLMCHAWSWEDAERAFRRAVTLAPDYPPARQWYSNFLASRRLWTGALAEARYAVDLDPRSAFVLSSLARHHQLRRDPDQARRHFELALELDPSFVGAHFGLAGTDLQENQPERCLERLDALAEGPPRGLPLLLALQAYATARAGDAEQARRLVQQLKASPVPYLPPEYVALGYVGLDEPDRALDWLERALDSRSPTMTLLGVEPLFDPIRSSERFRRLLDAVGLSEAPPP